MGEYLDDNVYQLDDGRKLNFGPKVSAKKRAQYIEQYETAAPEAAAGPISRESMASAARIAPPVVAGLATANPAIIGAAAGGGEMLAREIEQFEGVGSLPKLDTEADPFAIGGTEEDETEAARHFENALQGAQSGAYMAGAQAVMAPVLTKLLRAPNIALTQFKQLFGEIPENVAIAQRLLGRVSSKSDTYSLTLGQYFKHVGGWVSSAEQWARSAFGASKYMKRFDARNIGKVEDMMKIFFKGASKDLTSSQFGTILDDLFTGAVKMSNITKDWIYAGVKQLGDKAGAKFNFASLAKAITRPGAEGKVGVRPIEFAKSIATGIEGYLDDIGLSLGQLAEGAELTTTQAIELNRRINQTISKEGNEVAKSRMVDIMNKHVREPLKKTLKEFTEQGASLYDDAIALVGKHADTFDNVAMKGLAKQLANAPDDVVSMFSKAKNRVTNLKALREVFKGTGPKGEQLFEEHVLQPIRFSLFRGTFDSRTQRWIGSKMVDSIEKMVARDGGDFTNYIFGGEKNLSAITNMAKTLDVVEKTKVGESVMIQLVQGGALMGLLSAAAYGQGTGQTTLRNVAGMGAVIFMLPYGLALLATRSNLIRTITDGISHGPGTTKLTRTAIAVADLNKEAQAKWAKMSAETKEFYGNLLEGQTLGDAPFLPEDL